MAIVFGHEIHIFSLNLAKIHIFIPKCTKGGTIGSEKNPTKTIFLLLPLCWRDVDDDNADNDHA